MIVQRIAEYLKFKNIPVNRAEKEVGLSNGSLSKPINEGKTIKTNTLEKFLLRYNDINPHWLLFGEGNMLKDDKEVSKNAQNEGQKMADEKYIRDLVWSQTKEAFDSFLKNLVGYTIELQKEKIERLEEELKREKSLKRNADKADK